MMSYSRLNTPRIAPCTLSIACSQSTNPYHPCTTASWIRWWDCKRWNPRFAKEPLQRSSLGDGYSFAPAEYRTGNHKIDRNDEIEVAGEPDQVGRQHGCEQDRKQPHSHHRCIVYQAAAGPAEFHGTQRESCALIPSVQIKQRHHQRYGREAAAVND